MYPRQAKYGSVINPSLSAIRNSNNFVKETVASVINPSLSAIRNLTSLSNRWGLLLIDGTGVSMPDTPALQRAFGQPGNVKAGCGFPVMHVLWVFDAATGLIVDFIEAKWNRYDLADAHRLHASMHEADVLVGDRAFGSYAHLALLYQSQLHGVFRVHQRTIVSFTPRRKHKKQKRKDQRRGSPTSRYLKRFGRHDQLVEYTKPRERPSWMSAEHYVELPLTLVVRELRYTLKRRGYRTQQVTLVTTLTGQALPKLRGSGGSQTRTLAGKVPA